MSVQWKLGKALLVGIVLATSCFQGVILAADSSQKSSVTHARITRAQAERAALMRVPGGKVKGAKLERENGVLIWSVDIITPLTKKVAAVQVDARTGQVLSKLAQNPADRAEESVVGQKKSK
jgi:peptidase YpeB-like protein